VGLCDVLSRCYTGTPAGSIDLLAGTETLVANSTLADPGEITFTVQFIGDSAVGSYTNTAVAMAEDVFGQKLTDVDTADIVLPPLPSIEVTKTVVSITPVSGTSDQFDVRFLVSVTNNGDVTLTDVQATDDLAQRLDDTTTSIAQIVEDEVDVVDASLVQPAGSSFSTNSFFRADLQNPYLFSGPAAGRVLQPGEVVSVEFTAVIDTNGYDGLMDNKVVAEGDSDGNGTRDVMDMDVVDIEISATYELTLDKSLSGPVLTVGPNQFDVPFRITVTNTGTRALANVTLNDDLANQLPAGITLDGIVAGPSINAGLSQTVGSSLVVNGGFTGAGNDNLFDGTGFLQELDVYVIEFTARVTRDVGQATFDNKAIVTANPVLFGGVVDLSREIMAMDTVTVPLGTPDVELQKQTQSVVVVDAANRIYDVTFLLTFENTGDIPLTGVSLTDDLATVVSGAGGTLQSVTATDLQLTSGVGTLVKSGSFDAGITDDEALDGTGQMDPAAVYEFTYTARMQGPDVTTPTTMTNVADIDTAEGVDDTARDDFTLEPRPDEDIILVTKSVDKPTASLGDFVVFTLKGTNQSANGQTIDIVDFMPPGFSYVAGSGRLNGVAAEPTQSGLQLTWEDYNIGPNGAADDNYEVTFVSLINVGAGLGKHINRHQAFFANTTIPASAIAMAMVRVIEEPVFDCADVIGKVFNDKNRNGYQDQGEPGIPAARVVTVRGLSITTDEHGRFHVACGQIPDVLRGSNFIMKLDERSLPAGYRITTENPRVIRLTRGKTSKLNFGASISRVVRLDMSDEAFVAGQRKLNEKWRIGVQQLVKQLAKEPSTLRISYRTRLGRTQLTVDRVNMLVRYIRDRVEAAPGGYKVVIEPEIIRVVNRPAVKQQPTTQKVLRNKKQVIYLTPKGSLPVLPGSVIVPEEQWRGKYVVPEGYVLMRRPDGRYILRQVDQPNSRNGFGIGRGQPQ